MLNGGARKLVGDVLPHVFGERLRRQSRAPPDDSVLAHRNQLPVLRNPNEPVDRPWPFDDLLRDHHLFHAFEARKVEHRIEEDALHDGTQPPRAGFAVDGLARNGAKRLFRQRKVNRFHLEQPLVLFYQRVLRLCEDELQRSFVEVLQRGYHGKASDELGDQPIFQQVFGFDVPKYLAGLAILGRHHLGAKPDGGRAPARGYDLLEPREGASAHEQDVCGVDLEELLLRVLAPALRRHRRDRALHDLEQRLLHALARHVAGNGRIIGFAADLVDLVDVDDAALRALDIIVGGLQQLENDVLDILTDV